MSEMSILIVALLGLAGGLFVARRRGGSSIAKTRHEAEIAHEERVEKARDTHVKTLEKIEESKREDAGADPSDALNKMAERGEIRK